jgi:hypothetical protein
MVSSPFASFFRNLGGRKCVTKYDTIPLPLCPPRGAEKTHAYSVVTRNGAWALGIRLLIRDEPNRKLGELIGTISISIGGTTVFQATTQQLMTLYSNHGLRYGPSAMKLVRGEPSPDVFNLRPTSEGEASNLIEIPIPAYFLMGDNVLDLGNLPYHEVRVNVTLGSDKSWLSAMGKAFVAVDYGYTKVT